VECVRRLTKNGEIIIDKFLLNFLLCRRTWIFNKKKFLFSPEDARLQRLCVALRAGVRPSADNFINLLSMRPLVLLILDGWGIAPASKGNAIEAAKKPHFDKLWDKYPHTTLDASGKHVGLPDGWVGNSEAGHANIGAGRIVKDDMVIISEDITNGRFQKNLALNQTVDFVLKNKSRLHVMGMASDGQSPHSSLEHLYSIVELASARGVKEVYLHLFTDGRDAPQFNAIKIIGNIGKRVNGKGRIVSLIGRFYAMDRGKNWDRTKQAYDCLIGVDSLRFSTPEQAILHAYNKKVTDEYLEPSMIGASAKEQKKSRIQNEDGVIFFNARSDRARQLAKCFVQKEFNKLNPGSFRRNVALANILFCALTDFGPDLDHILTAYPAAALKETLPFVLENLKQVYIAETEKYAHMTYFINGGSADPVNSEIRVRVPSPIVKSYAQKPEMSVRAVTRETLRFLRANFNFVAINFANPDMVGHTGDFAAVVKAIEVVDGCVKEVARAVLKRHGTLIIIGDHGNAEKMLDLKTGEIWTGHTTNPVPFMLVDDSRRGMKICHGELANVAPTIYDIFGLKKLSNILHKSLIK